MMNNLFSIFDPSTSSFSLCWLLLMMALIMVPVNLWFSASSYMKSKSKSLSFLFKEVSFTMGKPKKSEIYFILTLFFTIFIINATALFPQVFSLTSHLVITLPLSLFSWALINMFGWLKNTNHMLSHLVPQGTPAALMSFMVLIELTSNLIRPITLCVRLTANLIAGHLLMTLLGNALLSLTWTVSSLVIIAPLILTILETAVAVIQSYVFMTLITLYVTEVK